MFSFDVSRSDHQLLMVSPHHTSSSRRPSLSPVTRPPWLSRLWDQVCLKLSNHLQVLVASSSAPTSSCAQWPLDVLYLGQIKASTSPSIRRPRPSSPCDGNRGSYQSTASTGSILWTTADEQTRAAVLEMTSHHNLTLVKLDQITLLTPFFCLKQNKNCDE